MNTLYFFIGVICEFFAVALTCVSIYFAYNIVLSMTDWDDDTWGLLAWKWLCRFLSFPLVLIFVMYIVRLPILGAFGLGLAFFLP